MNAGSSISLLLSLWLVACGAKTPISPEVAPVDPLTPSEEAQAVQGRLAGTSWVLVLDDNMAIWHWHTDGTYEYVQLERGETHVTENGTWYVQYWENLTGYIARRDRVATHFVNESETEVRHPQEELIPIGIIGPSLQGKISVTMYGRWQYEVMPEEDFEAWFATWSGG